MIVLTKQILFSIGCAFILNTFQDLLDSRYLIEFLKNNLITLQVALLAINSTTLSIVMNKLKDLSKDSPNLFRNTKKAMLFSIKEQITLIILAIISLMIYDSANIVTCEKAMNVLQITILTIFVLSIQVLYDTAKSIFITSE